MQHNVAFPHSGGQTCERLAADPSVVMTASIRDIPWNSPAPFATCPPVAKAGRLNAHANSRLTFPRGEMPVDLLAGTRRPAPDQQTQIRLITNPASGMTLSDGPERNAHAVQSLRGVEPVSGRMDG